MNLKNSGQDDTNNDTSDSNEPSPISDGNTGHIEAKANSSSHLEAVNSIKITD